MSLPSAKYFPPTNTTTHRTILLILLILLITSESNARSNASKDSSIFKYLGTVPAVPSVEHSAAYQSREPPRSVNEVSLPSTVYRLPSTVYRLHLRLTPLPPSTTSIPHPFPPLLNPHSPSQGPQRRSQALPLCLQTVCQGWQGLPHPRQTERQDIQARDNFVDEAEEGKLPDCQWTWKGGGGSWRRCQRRGEYGQRRPLSYNIIFTTYPLSLPSSPLPSSPLQPSPSPP